MAVRLLCTLSASLCFGLQHKIDKLPTQQLIHGDLHGDNIIIDLNKSLHLIDFDKMMLGPKVLIWQNLLLVACFLLQVS